ncbi:Alpha/Beta hydrolase protein [Bisporella sp. PMI_857]|nr:Alpha/Beta hydrolase protein [Bisporella sp. PMI_857]
MASTPGILYVTMQPQPSLPASQFHDWYNNEHGPTRLRLSFVQNGFRYRATDLSEADTDKPEWMAVYDITDMAELTKDEYLRLRGPPAKTQREADVMKQIKVDRKLYDLVQGWQSKDFSRLEDVAKEGTGNALVAVTMVLSPEAGKKEELDKWYRDEHVQLLSKVPGWLRTRRYVTSSIDPEAAIEYLTLHEYAPKNGLNGEEFLAAVDTPWRTKIMQDVVAEKRRRTYDLYYTFGPAPRYLAPNLSIWQSSDPKAAKTRTLLDSLGGAGAIESWVTTKDGVQLPFRLEGSADSDAPLIVLSNSILVDYEIWDGFVESFLSIQANKKFRILRYLTRGRTSICGSQAVTIDVLASDIIALLDALRVKKAAAIIGVSLGGATTLNTALTYPERVESFVSCDTSSKSPAGNSKAWGERIALSEKQGASALGESIVGTDLAEITTRRWFVPESYDGGALEETCLKVKKMVETNSLTGFKKSVNALFDYDMKEKMKAAKVRGSFLVGGKDGVLPATMKEMTGGYGGVAEYKVIDGAGHLPMVEKPKEFAEFITGFLGGR